MSASEWALVWVAVAATAVVLEVATMAFVAMYLAIGAAAAGVVAYVGGPMISQLATFAIMGVALLVLTRPVLKRKLEAADIPTNVSSVVGKRGIVTIPIDNDESTGQIRIGTEYWTARATSDDAPTIPVDARVRIVEVEGVTARVEQVADPAATTG